MGLSANQADFVTYCNILTLIQCLEIINYKRNHLKAFFFIVSPTNYGLIKGLGANQANFSTFSKETKNYIAYTDIKP